MARRRRHALARDLRLWIALAAAAALGPTCPGAQPFATVRLDAPRTGLLVDDPAPSVRASGRAGKNFSLASIEIELDGVPLLATLGLVPPFENQGGAVVLPTGPVTLSAFSVRTQTTHTATLEIAGLALGAHELVLSAERTADLVLVESESAFSLVTPFALAAEGIPAAARSLPAPRGPGNGELAHQTGGEPVTGPVESPGGSRLRAGFTPVAEALITGGP